MSRHDLMDALNDVIDERLSETESFASYHHTHDSGEFEDKVYQYLGDSFVVGGRCNVQRAFENAVRAVVDHWMGEDGDAEVRADLRIILRRARSLPAALALPILARTASDLLDAVCAHETATEVRDEPMAVTVGGVAVNGQPVVTSTGGY